MTDTDHHHGHQHSRGRLHRRLTPHGHGMGPMNDPGRYERLSGRLAARLYRRVARDVTTLRLPDGARVLDVGTGPGTMPRLIVGSAPGLAVDGIDVAPEMIAWAQQTATPGVTYTVADVAALPWPDATFDVVVSTLSQHHWADVDAGLREVRRVLRPGGQAWVYDVRWALPQEESVAAALGAGTSVVRERRLARTSWFNPIGRLVLRPV
ncbi:class I SAM-dependent methyltransferase [Cellulomonas humilata]|uniref:Ubiquinone/menaquinone biosynthesis C-methylase UbiE n=1 Tax=Cellulomonas humilata TaxID=144055 RepID=A0ABU0EAM8_9CELL|nr:class I SAM-dependent methyltransferase [Cellulomonas humilata]MDQ0371917.1 ubiquinone/menaquinone biosynthesis C-methylase UbiE [Cellulomonas humilata]